MVFRGTLQFDGLAGQNLPAPAINMIMLHVLKKKNYF